MFEEHQCSKDKSSSIFMLAVGGMLLDTWLVPAKKGKASSFVSRCPKGILCEGDGFLVERVWPDFIAGLYCRLLSELHATKS